MEWKGTCHVFQHSLHEGDYCGAQPCLSISRLKKDRQYPALGTQYPALGTQYPVPSTGKFLTCFLTNLPEKCGREVQEKRDLGFLKETESGSGCASKSADHQRTPRNF